MARRRLAALCQTLRSMNTVSPVCSQSDTTKLVQGMDLLTCASDNSDGRFIEVGFGTFMLAAQKHVKCSLSDLSPTGLLSEHYAWNIASFRNPAFRVLWYCKK